MRRPRALLAATLAAGGGGAIVAAGLGALWLRRPAPLAFDLFGHHAVLGAPAWLLLLALAPAVLAVQARTLADFTRPELALQTGLRIALLALLALVLARPALRRDGRDVSVVALVDVSDSVGDAELPRARAFVAELERASPRPVRVVRFAARPEEVVAPDGPASAALARFSGDGGSGTDLALALGLAAGMVEPGTLGRLVLLSDGLATAGDVAAEAERAAARHLRVFTRDTGGETRADVAVDGLSAPDDVRPHASFDVEVRLVTGSAGKARVRLEQDGRPNLPDAERDVTLAPGVNVVRFPSRVEAPGTTVYRARVLSADANQRRENDEGLLAVSTEGRPRVLYVESQLAAAGTFASALQTEKIDVDVRAPRGLPLRPDLDAYDLVVLSDVARGDVSERQLAALEAFVRDGGGLLVAGGASAFGAGGWGGSRLEALLPVRLDLPERRDEATLALALVIDKSGSMHGPKMELTKEAARATAEVMAPEDLISVVVFDSQAQAVVRLQRAANRGRIFSDIARIQASGGTNILAGLREALDQLGPARARKKHVILLSDGQSPYEGIPELVDDAVAGRVTFSAVGVGEGADQTLLQMVAARGGGRFYATRDPSTIPRIFTRETQKLARSSVVEEPTSMRAAKRAEMLGGVALEGAPRLRGYTVTRPRPQADLVLTTGGGDPLLARWQVGLGQVVAWTSDVKARWSADFARWTGFAKLWAQVARSTMRRRAQHHVPLHATLDGTTASVTVDAIGADDRFLAGLDGRLEIVDAQRPTAPPRTLALVETAPGRYQASFPAGGPGALLLRAALASHGRPIADAAGRLPVPYAPELRPPVPAGPGGDGGAAPAGAALLSDLAARTGGAAAATPSAVLDPGADVVPALRPVRTPLLLLALLVFLLDVAARRVRLAGRFAPRPARRPV